MWKIKKHENIFIVEMNSNKANLHNPAFFADFHAAFDEIDAQDAHAPLILTASGNIFSAGIDFNYSFSLFEKNDANAVRDWFNQYQKMMLRLFTAPRLTVAAINGHSFAGGAILALCCDFRLMAQGNFKFSINEVPVGVPMPSVYTEMIKFRLNSRVANESILTGDLYSTQQALEMGMVKALVEPEQLLEAAIKQCQIIPPSAYLAYRHSKKMLQYSTLQFISQHSKILEEETIKNICSADSLSAQKAALKKLEK